MENYHFIDPLKFLSEATSPYQTVIKSAEILKENGFEELELDQDWKLEPGTDYFVKVYGSTLVAFHFGKNLRSRLHLGAAHTDSPCLRIKPNAETTTRNYGKLNVEVYGGMIRSTWIDRPLSLAGKIVLMSNDPYHPKTVFVDARRPLMVIPHLAIHMNRQMNDGESFNQQKDMLPLITMLDGNRLSEPFFMNFLGSEFKLPVEDIFSYELTVYPCDPPCLVGIHNEFISGSRLDNLTSVMACLNGIINGSKKDGLHAVALFDNEEVGSKSKQGAASMVLPDILERIYLNQCFTTEQYLADLGKAFFFSLDVAHALHPNVPEKNDITNFPVLNGGVTLKIACSQSYAGDAEAIAIAKSLCSGHNIPCQVFLNRSDIAGGFTLGTLLSANLPIRTMDIGVTVLGMHSARETMGADDQDAINRLMTVFFE